MQILLESGFISVNLEEDDKELDLCLWDHRGENKGVRGFQTMLTKKDAKAIAKALDNWISFGKLELYPN